jgi:PleD family two-component response regulator
MVVHLQYRRGQLSRHAPEDFDGLRKQADAVMYEVKHSGRSRIFLREF